MYTMMSNYRMYIYVQYSKVGSRPYLWSWPSHPYPINDPINQYWFVRSWAISEVGCRLISTKNIWNWFLLVNIVMVKYSNLRYCKIKLSCIREFFSDVRFFEGRFEKEKRERWKPTGRSSDWLFQLFLFLYWSPRQIKTLLVQTLF